MFKDYTICMKNKDLYILFGLGSANGISNLVGHFFKGGGVKNFWFKLSL